MEPQGLMPWLGGQRWLDTTADALQPAVRSAFDALGPAKRTVKNFLNGTWLGHPLHPVLTDIPLGAWSVTVLLDAMEAGSNRKGIRAASDASLALGIAGAVGAAVTGLTDWSDTDARPRRTGMAHALANTGALLLFMASFAARRRGNRGSGKALAAAGFLTASAAAYIGGELVSHEQIGVDHSAGHELPDEFTGVLAESDLPAGESRRAHYNETPLLVVRRGDRLFAFVETCAHLGGPLAEGTLDGDTIVCPWHSSRFALESGAVVDGPSAFPQPCLEVRARGGQIEVRAPRR